MSSDLTFLTNEQGNTLRDRFHVLLGENTQLFDILVGYFYVSGFHSDVDAGGAKERLLGKIARMADSRGSAEVPGLSVETVRQRLQEWLRTVREGRDPA